MNRTPRDRTADKLAQMAKALRACGLRATRQRTALMTVLADAGDHPDAMELLGRAKAIDETVSLATVYRTLGALEREGLVQRHSFEGGGARFETTDAPHHDHIVDLDTEEIVEFQSDKIERLQREIAAEMGYDVVHHRLELYCRKRS